MIDRMIESIHEPISKQVNSQVAIKFIEFVQYVPKQLEDTIIETIANSPAKVAFNNGQPASSTKQQNTRFQRREMGIIPGAFPTTSTGDESTSNVYSSI
jgi:hypothetical protein